MGLPNEITTGLIGSSGYSGYQIDQSIVLDGSSDELQRTFSAGSRRTWTASVWVKRCELGSQQSILVSASLYEQLKFTAADKIEARFKDATSTLITDAVFRDVGSWYHIVWIVDSTNATSTLRHRIIVNGVEQTYSSSSYASQNSDSNDWNTAVVHYLSDRIGGTQELNGYLAEMHYCDGTAYEATDFGEFYNGTTAWRAIEPSGLLYGTNGFYLPFKQDGFDLGIDHQNGDPVPLCSGGSVHTAGTWQPSTADIFNDADDAGAITNGFVNGTSAIGYDFGSSKTVKTIHFNQNSGNYLTSVKVQYYNGSTWVDDSTHTVGSGINTIQVTGGNSGNQWRLLSNSSVSGGGANWQMREMEMYDGAQATNIWEVNGSPVQSSDSPTVNYATLNPLDDIASSDSISEGNLHFDGGTSGSVGFARATIGLSSGKWYWETTAATATAVSQIGIIDGDEQNTGNYGLYYFPESYCYENSGQKGNNNSRVAYGTAWSNNDVIGVALDLDNGAIWFSLNGTWQNSATAGEIEAGTTTNAAYTGLDNVFFPAVSHSAYSNPNLTVNFGQSGGLAYTPPSGFSEINAANLPDPTITDGSKNFKTTTWTGYTPTLYEQTRISSSTTINNSMVLDGSSDYLSRTPASAGDRKTWTWSGWIKRCSLGTNQALYGCRIDGNNVETAYFNTSDKLALFAFTGGPYVYVCTTDMVFRDVGSWYHIVVSKDAANTSLRVWVNGVEADLTFTTAVSNSVGAINSTSQHNLGIRSTAAYYYFNGYMSEIYFLDGTAVTDATDFGEFNSDNIWSPKAVSGLTYGTNGFYLPFTQDTPNLGTDYSGNGNDWTENGSPTQSSDSPTVNYCTLTPLSKNSNWTLSQGNLVAASGGSSGHGFRAGMGFPAGTAFYFEVARTAGFGAQVAIVNENYDWWTTGGNTPAQDANGWGWYDGSGIVENNSSTLTTINTYTTERLGVAVDADGKLYFAKSGTWENSADPAAGTGSVATMSGDFFFPAGGDHSSGGGNPTFQFYFAEDEWAYTAPTGFKAIAAVNLPAISDSDLYFNGGSADLVWIKSRSAATSHKLIDTVRGVGLNVSSDSTAAETGEATVNRIDKYGIHLGDDADVNNAASTYVAWMWKAGGAGVVNTDGTISSTVSVNDDAGFSIVYVASGGGAAGTIGHGLSAPPEMIINKNLADAVNWVVYHSGTASDAETDYLELSQTLAVQDDPGAWNDTAPTSTVFSVGSFNNVTGSGDPILFYCFRSIPGYSKVFSYTGNGSTDGPFVYLGFKARWIMTKRNGSSGWCIHDTERSPYNLADVSLRAETSAAEAGDGDKDILSNGFKVRNNGAEDNASGSTYIGIAFAENPFGGSNLPLGLAR